MSDPRIIYKNPDGGGICVVFPTPEALTKYTIEQIAEKDVPEGLPYVIVTAADIPEDFTFRDAWDIDESELTSGVGGSIMSFDPDPAEGA